MIFMHTLPKVKPGVDYMNKEDLDEIWLKSRDQLKNKKFLKDIEKFDIRTVTSDNIYQAKQLVKGYQFLMRDWKEH